MSLTTCEITELGRALWETDVKLKVAEVKSLDIEAGECDLQRFIYHFFMKRFWNSTLSFDDDAVISYEWYHPQLCSRHTVKEVTNWFEREGLEITHQYVDHYGITVRGKRT